MPLLLHFLSKQMILKVLTGSTTTSESWKSLCNVYLKHLCEQLMSKTSVHPTVSFSGSHLSVFICSRRDCSSPKERQCSDFSFCKRTFWSTVDETLADVVESKIPYCQYSHYLRDVCFVGTAQQKQKNQWNSESSHKPACLLWSSKCLLQALWGATTGQEREWQEMLTRTLSKPCTGQILASM